jgi:hypothetical protein
MGKDVIKLLLLKISQFVWLLVVLDCTYYRSICMNMLCFIIYYLRLFIYDAGAWKSKSINITKVVWNDI